MLQLCGSVARKMNTRWGIPQLHADKLSARIPTRTFAGGAVDHPATTLFLWRSVATKKATGGMLGFFLDDWVVFSNC
jgi:hypothetical protein